ncbi:hypothetical protein P8605_34635 [Streptomyces sp. T-3]|nr:hypothetical protein [Streptomyces sp. T-3]
MSEQNPNGDGGYKWGPDPQQPQPGYGYPGAPQPGYGYPAGAYGTPAMPPVPHPGGQYGAPAPGGGAPLLSIGDITVTGDSIITPAGPLPLKGAIWTATDMSRTEEKIPTHAVVLAIVFFIFCLLGLLFLLMKEKTTTGFIQVTVTSGGRHHSTMIPAQGPQTFPWVMGQVNYARSLSV